MSSTSRPQCNILMIVHNLPVPFDRRMWQEACTLRGLGFGVTVICPKSKIHSKSYEHIEGVDIFRYPVFFEADSSILGYLIEFAYCWFATFCLTLVVLARSPFQIIHTCNPPDTYFVLALLFRLFGVKFVFDHHDLSPELYLAKGHAKTSVVYRILLFLERMSFRTADLVVTVNESYRDIAKTRGAVPDSKIAVVRSGPRRTWTSQWTSESSRFSILREGRKYLAVFVGQMGKQDGLDYLLRAVQVYVDNYPSDTLFVVIGSGPCEQQIRNLAVELKISGHIRFTGRVLDNELVAYISAADVCLDPDPLNEFNNLSTMNKIVEYMSLGKPVVAFDLVEHRRTGLQGVHYVEANDVSKFAAGIRELIEDPAKRKRMSTFAQKRFQQALAWEISEKALVRAYRRLIDSAECAVPLSSPLGCIESR